MAAASPPPLRPLFCPHRISRFLISQNLPPKWTTHKNNNNACCTPRVAHFHHPHYHPAYHPFSLCSRLLYPRPTLYSLLRPRSPRFRHSLPLMTTPQAAAEESTQPFIRTVRVVIRGRVQGVFYRNWTVENATQLGLKGWVRNKRDGSVEALFSGNPDAVQEMEQRCRQGPPGAMVTGLQVVPSSDNPGFGFQRKHTASTICVSNSSRRVIYASENFQALINSYEFLADRARMRGGLVMVTHIKKILMRIFQEHISLPLLLQLLMMIVILIYCKRAARGREGEED